MSVPTVKSRLHNALDLTLSEKSRLQQLLADNENKLQNIYNQLGKHTHDMHTAALVPSGGFGFGGFAPAPSSGFGIGAAIAGAHPPANSVATAKRRRQDSE